MRNFYKFTFILLFSLCAKAQVPTATILSVDPVFCTDRPVFFVARASNTPTAYAWAISGKGVVTNGISDSSIVFTFSTPGVYSMSVTTTNSVGTSLTVRNISVNRSALASFNASLNSTGYPNELSLTDYSTNSVKNYWSFSDEGFKDSTSHYTKYYGTSGNYTVTLVAVSRSGCNDTLAYSFRISDSSSVVLPNVFTPNNDDVNDIFKPKTRGIVQLSAWVYSRYGTLIHSWDRVNGSWDGYTTSGMECKAGDYFVVVEATGFDGKKYRLKTTLTLMK